MAAMPTPSRDVRSSLDLAVGPRERGREVRASLDEVGLRRAGEGLEALRAEAGQPDGRDLDPVEGDDEWQRAIAASLAEHHGRRAQAPRPDEGPPPRPLALDQRGMAVGHRQGPAQSREGTEDGIGGERGARRRERQGRGREGRAANGAMNAGVDGRAANGGASEGGGAGMDFDLERAIAASMRDAQGEPPRERGEGRLERERARVREGRERERRDASSNRAARRDEQSVGAIGGIGVSQAIVQGPGGQAAAGQARGGARAGQATPRQIVDDFGEVVDVQAVGEARGRGAARGSQAVRPREEEVDRRHAHVGARESQHQLAGASEGRVEGQRNGQAGQRGERVQQVLEQVIRDSAPRPAIQSNAEAAAMRYFSIFLRQSLRLHLCLSARLPACEATVPSIFDVCTNAPGRQLRRRQRQGRRQRPLHVRRRRQQLKRKLLVLPLPPTPMPALPEIDTEHMCPVRLPQKTRVGGRAGHEPPRVIQGLRDTGR